MNEVFNNQVLLVDKPLTWTSFDVVNKLRYTGKFKKIGHAGTLDPLATGLLILCTGKKTKEIDTYQAQTKEYTGSLVLGKSTPSIDLETDFDAEYPTDHISEADLKTVAKQLSGEITQIPPIFSAIKVNGKRAYEAARKGQELKIKSRVVNVEVFEIETHNFPQIDFRIVCSKGTYIRSLVRDFGTLLQSGAYMSALRRTRIGDFNVSDAHSMEEMVEKIRSSNENLL
jgi:tRNA pseudouridine55 synthase